MAFETTDAALSGTTELPAQHEEGVELQPQDGEGVELQPQDGNVPTTKQPRLKILRTLEQEIEKEEEDDEPEKPLTRVEEIRKQLKRNLDGKAKILSFSQRKRLQLELTQLERQNRNPQVPPSLPQQRTITPVLRIGAKDACYPRAHEVECEHFVAYPEAEKESSTSQSVDTSDEEEEPESSKADMSAMFGKPRESNNDFGDMFGKPTDLGPSTPDKSPISEKLGECEINESTINESDSTLDTSDKDEIKPIPNGSICTYVYKKNSKYHRKGDPCEDTVAKHPKVGGEKFCSTHQPKDADYPEDICEHKRHKGWKEIKCPNRVSHDGSPDGERFCDKCIVLRQAQAEKLDRKPVRRGKCPNILQKGKRKGKVCNNPLPRAWFLRFMCKVKRRQRQEQHFRRRPKRPTTRLGHQTRRA
jgi:hypothetical protein